MFPLRLLFSVALSNAPNELPDETSSGNTADLLRAAGVESEAIVRLQNLVQKVGEPIARAENRPAFEVALQAALDSPELVANMAALAELSLEIDLAKVPSDLEPVIDQYVEKLGRAQRWKVRQTLDMLLEAVREFEQLEEPSFLAPDPADESEDFSFMVRGYRQAMANNPELMHEISKSTVCNLATAAALERHELVPEEVREGLVDHWYQSTHAALLLIDPVQKALNDVLQQSKGQQRLDRVTRMTYQQSVGPDGEITTSVYLVIEDGVSLQDAVHLTMDSKLSRKLKHKLHEIDPGTDFVSLKVRFASEPGPIEDILGA